MRIIVLSPSDMIKQEAQLVTKLFEHGLETYHLRKPKIPTLEIRKYIEAIPLVFHNRIVLHSHHRLATSYKIKGIHTTHSHRNSGLKSQLRELWLHIRRPKLHRSRSYHKLLNLHEDTGKFDYVFLSPVYDGLTDKLGSGFSVTTLRAALKKAKSPVIARGHITLSKIKELHELGFDGIALQNAIWSTPNPVEAFEHVLAHFQELNIDIE